MNPGIELVSIFSTIGEPIGDAEAIGGARNCGFVERDGNGGV